VQGVGCRVSGVVHLATPVLGAPLVLCKVVPGAKGEPRG
jgi:hypothetical protein